MRILFASHTYMQGPFVVGSHHLARQFAAAGHDVVHLSTPVTPFHLIKDELCRKRFRLSGKGLIESEKNLLEYIPRTLTPAGIFRTKQRDFGLLFSYPRIAQVLRKIKFHQPELMLIDQPSLVGLLSIIEPGISIYRPTDIYPEMTGSPRTRAQEIDILKYVDGVIATSEPVLQHVMSLTNRDIPSMITENGVETAHFSLPAKEPDDISSIPHPRAIYTGALDNRFDWDIVTKAAKERPDYNFVLVGPTVKLTQHITSLKNIHLLGPKKYQDLPGYLQASDVAILPMIKSPANEGRSPMKLYEYMAAGLGVVASSTDELVRRAAPGVFLYTNLTSFITGLEEIQPPETTLDLAELDWSKKAQLILTFTAQLDRCT